MLAKEHARHFWLHPCLCTAIQCLFVFGFTLACELPSNTWLFLAPPFPMDCRPMALCFCHQSGLCIALHCLSISGSTLAIRCLSHVRVSVTNATTGKLLFRPSLPCLLDTHAPTRLFVRLSVSVSLCVLLTITPLRILFWCTWYSTHIEPYNACDEICTVF
jgi:hypothetical protein